MPDLGSNFISAEKLNLELNDNWTIIDTRFSLMEPEWGMNSYLENHIPGAIYMQLEYDFSAPVETHGGRHPLPERAAFTKTLFAKGVDLDQTVVIYDETYPENAARLWWMLRYLYGKDDVYILNGGFNAWKKAELPLEKGHVDTKPLPKSNLEEDKSFICGSDELLKKIKNRDNFALIDARSPERFFGKEEPIDPIAGHIPMAINFFWQSAYDSDGKILEVDKLLPCMSNLAHYENIIAYCGSGVTACGIILAMNESGVRNVRLYAGSWSDWITHKDYPKVLPES